MTQEKRRFLDSNSATPTFIGANSVFVGDIRGTGQFVVSGEVHGDGELEGALNLSRPAAGTGRSGRSKRSSRAPSWAA
jgi:cytoskeletal protein CcmA (bactofilin family)